MPLLKRKRYKLEEPPVLDMSKKESRDLTVWYSPMSDEIFKDYPTYLQRSALYRKPIWQCESTGRSNLTFRQALDSERAEKEKVKDKLPEQLQKRVLERAQFQTGRLDAIVDDVYNFFLEKYVPGEIINCTWDDGIAYNARVLDTFQAANDAKDHGEPGLSNGPTNGTTDHTVTRYKMQLIDENYDGIEDCIKVVEKKDLKRDRLAFSKNLLKKFLRDCTTKDTYASAPLIIKDIVAERFEMDTVLPFELQEAKEHAYSKARKRKLPDEKTSSAKSGPHDGMIDAKRLEIIVKYPMEDLDIPVYRREQTGPGNVIDMTPGTVNAGRDAQHPNGGMPLRPRSQHDSFVPTECLSSLLVVWTFLNVFARPLELYPFNLDDFESALCDRSSDNKPQLLIESNAALLNVIIQHLRITKDPMQGFLASATNTALGVPNLRTSRSSTPIDTLKKDENGTINVDLNEGYRGDHTIPYDAQEPATANTVQSSANEAVFVVGHQWDKKLLKSGNDREGWGDMLVGFIDQFAPAEDRDEFNHILNRLVPHPESTREEREEAYVRLKSKEKIRVFELLVSVANESSCIKKYMEECQDQLTELRKERIDLSRERKRIVAERLELEKKESGKEDEKTEGPIESDDDSDASDSENIRKAQRQAEEASRHESRQAILKRKQAERQQQEAKRLKLHHRQREEARVRNQEMKARADARRKLDEEERRVHRNLEQVDRDMRKYSTLRIKPLGRDKFYNRYYYLDNVGGANAHGTGKLFVQSPSEIDLEVLRERDNPASVSNESALPCGRGGGIRFVCQLMKDQGMEEESAFLEQRIQGTSAAQEWWHFYDDPEDIENVIHWLNPKGIREYRLKNELEKHVHSLTAGMKKRSSDQSVTKDVPRRSTRSKAAPAFAPGSWQAYQNKYAKH